MARYLGKAIKIQNVESLGATTGVRYYFQERPAVFTTRQDMEVELGDHLYITDHGQWLKRL